MRHTLSELTGPVYGHETVRENDNDLTLQGKGDPLGERIIVHGHVLDEDGRGVPNTLVELWQADDMGAYIHSKGAPRGQRDAHFQGYGKFETASDGGWRFRTIKPGLYAGRTRHYLVDAHPIAGPGGDTVGAVVDRKSVV